MQSDRRYVIDELKGVSRSLQRLAEQVARQIKRADEPPESKSYTPLDDLAENVAHDIAWAIPNLHLERLVRRAAQCVAEEKRDESRKAG